MYNIIEIIDNAKQYGIHITREELHPRIRGFVYPCPDDHYHVLINLKLNYESQCRTAIHEITHVRHHLPNMVYFIGLNMQHIKMEDEANEIASKYIKSL